MECLSNIGVSFEKKRACTRLSCHSIHSMYAVFLVAQPQRSHSAAHPTHPSAAPHLCPMAKRTKTEVVVLLRSLNYDCWFHLGSFMCKTSIRHVGVAFCKQDAHIRRVVLEGFARDTTNVWKDGWYEAVSAIILAQYKCTEFQCSMIQAYDELAAEAMLRKSLLEIMRPHPMVKRYVNSDKSVIYGQAFNCPTCDGADCPCAHGQVGAAVLGGYALHALLPYQRRRLWTPNDIDVFVRNPQYKSVGALHRTVVSWLACMRSMGFVGPHAVKLTTSLVDTSYPRDLVDQDDTYNENEVSAHRTHMKTRVVAFNKLLATEDGMDMDRFRVLVRAFIQELVTGAFVNEYDRRVLNFDISVMKLSAKTVSFILMTNFKDTFSTIMSHFDINICQVGLVVGEAGNADVLMVDEATTRRDIALGRCRSQLTDVSWEHENETPTNRITQHKNRLIKYTSRGFTPYAAFGGAPRVY